MHRQVTMAWFERLYVKFLEIIEILEACGNLIYGSWEVD